MEHMNKSLETASSQAEGVSADYTVDRLSNAPPEVAHHILAFLDFRDLIRLGSVSKMCRVFSLSAPSLEVSSSEAGNRRQQLNLLNSIDRYMIHRGDDKIKHFLVDWSFSAGISEEVFRMMTWIRIAVRCNVEVLELRLWAPELNRIESDGTVLELPSCVYCCESLRSLLIKTQTILKAPSVTCSNNLQYLKLTNVRMEDGFGKWISHSCKCIKELLLFDVRVLSFTVESSSLESFSFVSMYNNDLCHIGISGEKLTKIRIEWEFYKTSSGTTRSLNISAPNLKYLKWIGNLLNYQNLGKFMCLEKAHIFLKHKGDDYDFDNAFEVLCSLCRVKVLILSEETTKVLLREGLVHAPLDDITYLSMHIMSLTDDLVPAMVSLLRGMPNLSTLYIKSYPSLHIGKPKACGFKSKYWKSHKLDCVHQLQDVSIALSTGYINNALDLVRYILENASNLKQMIIFYLPRQSYVIGRVNKFKKISSAIVVFKERELNDDGVMGKSYHRVLNRLHWL
ncbi:putative F-box domain, leucine-rich repeat domain, L domain-containing protein [Rosa chinensis]|uniref:Putative F-box domain, leucine-rich repeat domain, L domain-containing protein n=1 Tax=Rosa chinensis TaxID=74649 RepID=A0A2P6P924_ROSCH|nr:F-box/LRR-repeat protein 13 [Rosa chinensis]PRQ18430.1 putative F-box domain, leucine-rich repeat domain, L domain-containing protein [Rosa chinensis]